MQKLHLGIYLGHDVGVALVDGDGKPVFIGEESRFCGYKSPFFHPVGALRHLRDLGVTEVESLSWAFLEHCPPGLMWTRFFRYLEELRPGLRRHLSRWMSWKTEQYFSHHEGHAASALLASPFERALVVVADGAGEDDSLSVYLGDRNSTPILRCVESLPSEHFSFGHLYDGLTKELGYRSGRGADHAGKIMGLSSYGRPRYLSHFNLLFRQESGRHPRFPPNWRAHFGRMLAGCPSLREGFTDLQADMAASLQRFVEDEMLVLLTRLRAEYPEYDRLCFAGGVAMNSLMNGHLLARQVFDDIFIQPLSSDSGLAYGAAALAAAMDSGRSDVESSAWTTCYHGFAHADIAAELADLTRLYDLPLRIEKGAATPARVAALLAEGKVVGVFRGAQEVGPRSLGNRSILSLPTVEMRDRVNCRIKFREPWRPFAPILREEDTAAYFGRHRPEPFMTAVYDVNPQRQNEIAGTVHFDNTSRLQTVNAGQNAFIHALLSAMPNHGKPAVLLNTSFNVDGQSVVRTVWDALCTMLVSGLDAVVIGDDLVTATADTPWPRNTLSVIDRQLEPRLRNATAISLLDLEGAEASERMERALSMLPSIAKRRKPLPVTAPDQAPEDAILLVHVGGPGWIEDAQYIVHRWEQAGRVPSLLGRFPQLAQQIRRFGDDNVVLYDDTGLVMPASYYLDVMGEV